jgi:hypothetical protein
MKNLVRSILTTLVLLSCAFPGTSQRLIFSVDTVILTSCEKAPIPIDSHVIYNNTDEDIVLRWERTELDLPEESFYLMIFGGIQYLYITSNGWVRLDAHDSTEIIFGFWHDTLVPGDSVVVQILVYDIDDSLNTAQELTMIQHCPLATSRVEPVPEPILQVYPNPIHHTATIILPEDIPVHSLALYSITGALLKQIPVTNNEMTFSTDGIPEGMYFLGGVYNGHVTAMTKIIILK